MRVWERRGESILSEVVLPMLRDGAGLRVEVHVTEARAHATRIVRNLDLSDVSVRARVGRVLRGGPHGAGGGGGVRSV